MLITYVKIFDFILKFNETNDIVNYIYISEMKTPLKNVIYPYNCNIEHENVICFKPL